MSNVLFVLNFTNSFEGSFMRSIKALSEEIQRDDGKAVMLLPEQAKNNQWVQELIAQGENVFFFSDSVLSIFKNTKLIKKIVKDFDISIIHSHFANYKQHIPISFAISAKKNIDYIVHVHYEPKSKNRLYDKLAELITNATLYICVSESIKNKLSIDGKRCTTIMNAVDFSRLESFDAEIKKSDFLAPSCTKSVLMFGQNFEEKGVDFVIKTLIEMDPEHEIQLLVAVSENINEAAKTVKALCGDVPEWIKLLPARNDIATYFNLADVFVLANRKEGNPYTMIECAYTGVPIIYCDIPGQNELNIPWSVKVALEDSYELYKAMCEIFKEDASDTYSMGLESKEYVVNHFSLGSWVYEIINIYKNIYRI